MAKWQNGGVAYFEFSLNTFCKIVPNCIFKNLHITILIAIFAEIIIRDMTKIIVQYTEINVVKVNNEDNIFLTDMIKAKDGDFFVTDWLRNRNTLEYLGI